MAARPHDVSRKRFFAAIRRIQGGDELKSVRLRDLASEYGGALSLMHRKLRSLERLGFFRIERRGQEYLIRWPETEIARLKRENAKLRALVTELRTQ